MRPEASPFTFPEDPPVPDQTVKVSFDDSDPKEPKFTFDPESVRMTAAGKVILTQHPASPRWIFRGATVKDDDTGEFSVTVKGGGNALEIDDKCRRKREYSYNVTVTTTAKATYTSPDPVIVNDPGTGI